MVSVLLSAFNESSNPYFWKTIEMVQALMSSGVAIELIVVATPGTDDTIEKLQLLRVKTIICQTSLRAERYNVAFKESSGEDNDWIVLNHPRSLLSDEAFKSLLKLNKTVQWGAFTHEFDYKHFLLRFTSWWSNYVRGDIKKIFYLDHCIFVRKGLFEKTGGIPQVEIFEDTLLSKKLSHFSSPIRLPWRSMTSSIRFIKNGLWRQAIQNQILKIQFLMGVCDKQLNSEYEKNINLNTKVGH